jgi:hypothetical protein
VVITICKTDKLIDFPPKQSKDQPSVIVLCGFPMLSAALTASFVWESCHKFLSLNLGLNGLFQFFVPYSTVAMTV